MIGLRHGTVASFQYTLDKVGNRTSKISKESERYVYDSTYQLLGVVSSSPENYSYDAVGNRLTGPGAKDTGYVYNAANQMLQGRSLRYGYDHNGNQITRSAPGAKDGSWSLTWDYDNRLIKMEKVKGAEKKIIRFFYDWQGRRIGKEVKTVQDGTTKTEAHRYVYDNDNIILEVVSGESVASNTFFTHGFGVDEHLAMERSGEVVYYHADGLGTVVALTDQKKRVNQTFDYTAFGLLKPSSSSGFNSYTYTGREWDKEIGLYYYRARYYDPMKGRFISKDPIGFKGGVNQYSYVKNDPINNTDPHGLINFRYHGKWCGPGWTGGKHESYTPGHKYADPVDTLDTYCMMHDMCYSDCRINYPCDSKARGACMTKCDRQLADGAAFSRRWASPLGAWMKHNNSPDAGPNASCCNGKK